MCVCVCGCCSFVFEFCFVFNFHTKLSPTCVTWGLFTFLGKQSHWCTVTDLQTHVLLHLSHKKLYQKKNFWKHMIMDAKKRQVRARASQEWSLKITQFGLLSLNCNYSVVIPVVPFVAKKCRHCSGFMWYCTIS